MPKDWGYLDSYHNSAAMMLMCFNKLRNINNPGFTGSIKIMAKIGEPSIEHKLLPTDSDKMESIRTEL